MSEKLIIIRGNSGSGKSTVAKIIIIDENNKYLLLKRSEHPRFPNDADLPGGGVEKDESTLQAVLREVLEEIGVSIDKDLVKKVYEGDEYSAHKTSYCLYIAQLPKRPQITISWEHSSFEWLNRNKFLERAQGAKDTYMHMVYDVLKDRSV